MNRSCGKPTLILLLIWAVLSSCVSTSPLLQKADAPDGGCYRSADYVLCQKDAAKSLADLATDYYGSPGDVWRIEDANDGLSNLPFIVIPLKQKNLGGLYENGYQEVPILCYHKFGPGRKSVLNTPPDIFTAQMQYLKDNGYRVITPADLLGFLKFSRQIPKKAVMITIDDGFKSALTIAAPILMKFGFTATLFVYIDYIGISKEAVTWEDLRILKANGFYIGSHSTSHSDLSKKTEDETQDDYKKRLYKEIFLSKDEIDKKLNQNTLIFSFPYGRYNSHVMALAQEAGYQMAVTVDRGGNPFFSNPLALKRDMIFKKDLNTFKKRLDIFTEISLK